MDTFRVMEPFYEAFEYWWTCIRISSECFYLNWIPNLYIITLHILVSLEKITKHKCNLNNYHPMTILQNFMNLA